MNALQVLLQNFGQLFTWLVIVAPWEQALRVRLGNRVELLQAGCHLRIPFIDRVYRQTVRPRMFTIRPQTLTTEDNRTITLSGAVGFSIADLRKLFETLHDALDTIEARICSMVAEYVATHQLGECEPAKIEAHVREKLDLAEYGLSDQTFCVTNFAVVRTYRLISGDLPAWSQGNALNTQMDDRTQ